MVVGQAVDYNKEWGQKKKKKKKGKQDKQDKQGKQDICGRGGFLAWLRNAMRNRVRHSGARQRQRLPGCLAVREAEEVEEVEETEREAEEADKVVSLSFRAFGLRPQARGWLRRLIILNTYLFQEGSMVDWLIFHWRWVGYWSRAILRGVDSLGHWGPTGASLWSETAKYTPRISDLPDQTTTNHQPKPTTRQGWTS